MNKINVEKVLGIIFLVLIIIYFLWAMFYIIINW